MNGSSKDRSPETPDDDRPETSSTPPGSEGSAAARPEPLSSPSTTPPTEAEDADGTQPSQTYTDRDQCTLAHAADLPSSRGDPQEPWTTPSDSLRISIELGIPVQPPRREGAIGTVGNYQILNLVGRGGMGVVVRAFDEVLHRNVALKVMSPALIASDRARQRFFREARSAAGINHPNVVTIHAVDEQQGVPYLVMEYVEGQTLDEWIRQEKPLDAGDVIRIGTQIARGLAAAHAQGVVHRDIKPANILREDGVQRVKLTDFGLARLLVDNSDLTSQGNMIGTPAYMSPEQVCGEEVTGQSDLFSLGCVFYEMLSGRNPFRAATPTATSHRIRTLQPAPLWKVHPHLPAELCEIVDHLLQKDPHRRPASSSEVAQRMSRLLVSANQGSDRPAAALRRPAWRARRRWAIPLVVLATMFAATLAAGSWYVGSWRLRETAVPGPPAEGPWIVSPDRQGHFPTIAAALQAAGPGQQIRILAGHYHESLLLDDAERLRGVVLRGSGSVRLSGPASAPVIHLNGVGGVSLTGLGIDVRRDQHGLRINGPCANLTIADCLFSCAGDEPAALAVLYADAGASGTADAPILVNRCTFADSRIGIVVGSNDPSAPTTAHLRIENCDVRCNSDEVGIPLVLQGRVADIVVRNNLLIGGRRSISISYLDADLAEAVLLQNNTFHSDGIALAFNASDASQGIRLVGNLFVLSQELQSLQRPLADFVGWFDANGWIPSPATNDAIVEMFASRYPPEVLQSTDPQHPRYLQPSRQAPDTLPGRTAPIPAALGNLRPLPAPGLPGDRTP